MKTRSIFTTAVLLVLCFVGSAGAQQTQPSDDIDLMPGFKMRTSGGIDISELYAEVVQFDSNWKETEEHDVFTPTVTTPDANTHVATGTFAVPDGTLNLTERVSTIDGGISFSADVSSDKEVQCNELSLGFRLPVAAVGGKEIVVDDEKVMMPMEPAKKGESHIFDKENVQKIEIPTPTGTLTVTGNMTILLQDDREWGDPRYGLRIQFSPGEGAIKSSKIEIQMKWKPAAPAH